MDETLHLRDIVDTLRRRWRVVALFFISGLIAALVFLMVVTPKFTAEATLKFDPRQFQISTENKSVASDFFERLIAGEIGIMTSRDLMRRVVETEKLVDDPEFNRRGILDHMRLLFTGDALGEASWDARIDQIVDRFEKILWVSNPDRTNLITIRFTSEDPAKAARLTNAVVNAYLAQHLEQQIDATPLASQWLNDRIAVLRAKWQESESDVERFKSANDLNFVVGENLQEQHISKLNEQLVLARANAEAARAKLEQVRGLVNKRDYTKLANAVRSDVMTRLRDRFAGASQREASLAESLLPAHPTLRESRARVVRLGQLIIAEGRRTLANLQSEFEAARDREKLIRAELDKTVAGLQQAGDNIVKLRELERTAASNKAIFDAFVSRSKETSEQATGQFVNFRLVQQARPPTKPSFPSRLKVLLFAALGAFALGIGAAFVVDSLAPAAAAAPAPATAAPTADDTPPPIAILPTASIAAARTRGIAVRRERLVVQDPGSPFAEAMTQLTAPLTAHVAQQGSMILAVTSGIAREGKTLVAASLAQQAAMTGARVALIDCNFENRDATGIFRALHDWTAVNDDRGDADAEPPLLTDRSTGLDIVPAYADMEDALRYVGSRAFADLLSSAKASFDLVVLDTGALLSHPEARVLVGLADATLLVIDQRTTSRDRTTLGLRTLSNCRATTLGLVLNHGANTTSATNTTSEEARAPHRNDIDWTAGRSGEAKVRFERLPKPH